MTSNPDCSSKQNYDRRKLFIDELKTLDKNEYEELFRLIKKIEIEFSENSNGIFFDVSSVDDTQFASLEEFMSRLKTQKDVETKRVKELDALRNTKM
jgi:hypothetical protein